MMLNNTVKELKTVSKNIRGLVEGALAENEGLLRLAPCWVPRSFLQPGKRLKLHPDDLYAYGLNRGGIDERWFASTTPAANENRTPDEGLSYVVAGKSRCTLADAVAELGAVRRPRLKLTRATSRRPSHTSHSCPSILSFAASRAALSSSASIHSADATLLAPSRQ